ncbi:hypothetical protein F5882DRAFT_506105 [Hyaloscypha sp. PMI_1271]|nr:hypothetical protein F5882DRAFT_506105 [Hyaloscypha sp. PMI_1271]
MTAPRETIWWRPSEEIGTLEFDAHTKCSFVELLHGPGLPRMVKTEGFLDDDSLGQWFEKDQPVHATGMGEGKHFEIAGSRLRILFATCGISSKTHKPEVSISKKAFAVIKDRLRLPNYFLTNIPRDHLARTTSFSGDTSKEQIHDLAVHPLLLPIAAIGREIDRARRRIHRWDKDVDELEEVMGQHDSEGRPLGNPLEMNFTSKTRKLNYLSKRVGVDILHLGYVKFSLEIVESWNKSSICGGKESLDGVGEPICHAMKEKTILMKEDCRLLLLLAEYEEKRMKVLIQAVYQFMAQKDARVNIELALNSAAIAKASKEDSAIMRQIAIETKRDSSAMKTIALLGMLFLPGTFVAAIFAMPVIDWEAEGMPVVKKGFKYYWAVTAPLTLLVLASWGLAMLFPWKKWISRLIESPQTRGRDIELTGLNLD